MEVVQQWQQLLATGPTRLLGLGVWLLLMAALLIPLERRWPLRRQSTLRAGLADDIAYFFLGGMVPAFVIVVFATAALWVQQQGPVAFYAWVGSLPLTVRVVATILISEVVYYWAHRWSHEIPWLWRFHAIHHSPTSLDWLVNTRAHPLDLAFSRSLTTVMLLMLGLTYGADTDVAGIVALVIIFNTSWGFFVHSNLRVRLGVLEHLVTTPAFHHWHHTNDGADYANRNYAALLPWIDRLFGTHYLPPAQYPQRYGIDMAMPADLSAQLLLPFRPDGADQGERPAP